MPDIMVLCSTGRHPASERPRAAAGDLRALALALGMEGRVRGLHAGDPSQPVLRDFLGQTVGGRSLEQLCVLDVAADRDPRAALIAHLRGQPADIVLTGTRAEDGEGSGMLGYDLAAALGWPMLAAISQITPLGENRYRLIQVLPRGRRRELLVTGPLVASVDTAAPARPIYAASRARRGRIAVVDPGAELPLRAADARIRPARARPKRLPGAGAGDTAASRLRAISETQSGQGQLMVDPEADEAARAIADYLRAEGFLGARRE